MDDYFGDGGNQPTNQTTNDNNGRTPQASLLQPFFFFFFFFFSILQKTSLHVTHLYFCNNPPFPFYGKFFCIQPGERVLAFYHHTFFFFFFFSFFSTFHWREIADTHTRREKKENFLYYTHR
ncbi:hypothetical protein QBC42DRAFT_54852 [Cladorrhinum samala]|uniref:Uncharacterized protein n=1 Tax=Cladorrhinum samala TaxID=585594 RepID=A0AAV9H882_9PEZI|nr:hypothetical protein QBC42DRAFT_54852 [Cladorrhinum samala]